MYLQKVVIIPTRSSASGYITPRYYPLYRKWNCKILSL